MFARKLSVALSACAITLTAGRAHAQSISDREPRIEASLGARVSDVSNAGFDPFADSDELAQLSLGLGGALLTEGRLSLAAVGFWDYGERSSEARGAPTSLSVHRLSIGPEARFHVLPRFYVFAHVLPAFAYSRAELDDGITDAPRTARHWAYGVDAAAGAAFEMYSRHRGRLRPQLWLVAEGGYGYLGSTRLSLKARDGSPERTAPVDLGSLSLAGPYARLSVAVGF
jgi:hypothetical protein